MRRQFSEQRPASASQDAYLDVRSADADLGVIKPPYMPPGKRTQLSDSQFYTRCLGKNRTPAKFWHNSFKTSRLRIIFGGGDSEGIAY